MATVDFKKIHTAKRGTSTYKAEGYPGVLLMAKPAFNGEHPDSITVVEVPDPKPGEAKAAKPKLTKEQQDAARAAEKARWDALTPEQKAAEIREKAAAKRQKLAEALKKAEERAAKLGASAPAPDGDAPAQ